MLLRCCFRGVRRTPLPRQLELFFFFAYRWRFLFLICDSKGEKKKNKLEIGNVLPFFFSPFLVELDLLFWYFEVNCHLAWGKGAEEKEEKRQEGSLLSLPRADASPLALRGRACGLPLQYIFAHPIYQHIIRVLDIVSNPPFNIINPAGTCMPRAVEIKYQESHGIWYLKGTAKGCPLHPYWP